MSQSLPLCPVLLWGLEEEKLRLRTGVEQRRRQDLAVSVREAVWLSGGWYPEVQSADLALPPQGRLAFTRFPRLSWAGPTTRNGSDLWCHQPKSSTLTTALDLRFNYLNRFSIF